jgi:formylglycine-generating enzyme required for sulfatase activity
MAFVLLLLALVLPSAAIAQSPAAKPGTRFRDCADCPEMVVIPPGQFLMGAPEGEPGAAVGEGPQRRVAIRGFAAGRFDVTRAQWSAFVAATNRPTQGGCAYASATAGAKLDPEASWSRLGFPQDDDHPVVCVTFADAQDYAAWLSRKAGHRYRLLSEAEWEYAARAGTRTAHYWGPAASHERANYGAEVCCSPLASGRDRWEATSPVGAFPPNPFGLYDMHGDVMTWVQDCLHNYPDGPVDGSAYEIAAPLKAGPIVAGRLIGTNACDYRMLRGGDWGNPPRMIRSASRNYAPAPGLTLAAYRSGGLGFRVARALD